MGFRRTVERIEGGTERDMNGFLVFLFVGCGKAEDDGGKAREAEDAESIAFGQLLDRELEGWNVGEDVECCVGSGFEHAEDTSKGGVLDFLQLFEVAFLGLV